MRIIKKTMLLIICFMISLILKGNTVFAKSVIQVVPDVAAWNNISVSDAYDVCQDLNADYSTLGTDKLKAHLTTNADWYAVSLLAYSDYGNKSASNTTGNNTGIQKFGTKGSWTAALMEVYNAANGRITSLINAINTTPKYVDVIKKPSLRNENIFGKGLLSKEVLSNSFGSEDYGYSDGDASTYPALARFSLFGYSTANHYNSYCTGQASSSITFRPVIWNK